MANTEYIGLTSVDYWQYIFMRVMPFLTIILNTFVLDHLNFMHSRDNTLDYLLLALFVYHICFFAFYDWSKSTECQLDQYFEEQFGDDMWGKGHAKKLEVEKNSKKLKFILYREQGDGGI